MLSTSKVVAFVPTTDAVRARSFYQDILGLRFISDDPFALVMDANGTRLRIVKLKAFTPAPYTILGWEVSNIHELAANMAKKGVVFERYEQLPQDNLGIWTAPGGARVAWFKDPHGNVLSISEHVQ
jgi:catechol 2,3-dioxygenase-like lactoylglutathione lyase family enzyme